MPHPMKPSDIAARNSEFYDALWAKTYLVRPERFNTWPLISELMPSAPMRLEVGPGLRPRLPIAGTHFIDISPPAIERLNAGGGIARSGEITALPFDDGSFDLVMACDVIEHVEDDRRVFAELSRVLKEDGRLIFSVPLHSAYWNEFDDYVGHARRYEPPELRELIADHGLVVEKSAVFGMQPNNPGMLRFAVKWLTEHRSAALRYYNWLLLPFGLLFQKRLRFTDGLIDLTGVYEVLLVCRRRTPSVGS
jgi:SAM-dependent methyltransferase